MRAKYNDCDDLKLGTAMMPSVRVTPVRPRRLTPGRLQMSGGRWPCRILMQGAALRLHVTLDSVPPP
jgi:hypothetical protein